MGKDKKTRAASVKRMISPKDARLFVTTDHLQTHPNLCLIW